MIEPVLKKVEYGAYHQPGLNRYAVYAGGLDQPLMGYVYSHFPTITGPKIGRNVVAWRRTGTTREWRYETADNPGRWSSTYTRAHAVHLLLEAYVAKHGDVSES